VFGTYISSRHEKNGSKKRGERSIVIRNVRNVFAAPLYCALFLFVATRLRDAFLLGCNLRNCIFQTGHDADPERPKEKIRSKGLDSSSLWKEESLTSSRCCESIAIIVFPLNIVFLSQLQFPFCLHNLSKLLKDRQENVSLFYFQAEEKLARGRMSEDHE